MSEWAAEAMSLYERAVNALSHIYAPERLGLRPQVFVAHSFGGLLVKQMLYLGLTMGRDDWIGTHKTVGVVFLATPHSGAELARLATKIKPFRASAFSQSISEALVWCTNTWHSPCRTPHRETIPATSSVSSMLPLPWVR